MFCDPNLNILEKRELIEKPVFYPLGGRDFGRRAASACRRRGVLSLK
jgi:hypothetical protein